MPNANHRTCAEYICTYIHAYIPTCVRTCICTYPHRCIHTRRHTECVFMYAECATCVRALNAYTHAHIHVYIHEYLHTYIHTRTHPSLFSYHCAISASLRCIQQAHTHTYNTYTHKHTQAHTHTHIYIRLKTLLTKMHTHTYNTHANTHTHTLSLTQDKWKRHEFAIARSDLDSARSTARDEQVSASTYRRLSLHSQRGMRIHAYVYFDKLRNEAKLVCVCFYVCMHARMCVSDEHGMVSI
jgi:hypothetical protein